MRSDGNSAVKMEGGGGQRLYLYTVKIANFRQILMSSPLNMETCHENIILTKMRPLSTDGAILILVFVS